MEPRKTPPEYFLEIFADTSSVKDVLKGWASFRFPFFILSHLSRFFHGLESRCRVCGEDGEKDRAQREREITRKLKQKSKSKVSALTVAFSSHLGVLNLIFFHRYFPSIRPSTVDVLDLTLPVINDVELETLIDSRVTSLVRQHLSSSNAYGGGGGGVRGRIAVEFFEKKRKRAGLWFGGLAGKGEEEVCWEIWTLDVTIATPKTESGEYLVSSSRTGLTIAGEPRKQSY